MVDGAFRDACLRCYLLGIGGREALGSEDLAGRANERGAGLTALHNLLFRYGHKKSPISVTSVLQMPKFVIEGELPGAGKLSSPELHDISAQSNKVISDLGPGIHWLNSYVTDDKLYCVYIAPDADIIFEHARCGGFPADKVSLVSAVIDPSTGD